MTMIAPHIQGWANADAWGFVQRSKPAFIKVMGAALDRGKLAEYKALVPDGKVLGRVWTDDEPLTDPTNSAQRVVNRILGGLGNVLDLVDIIECDVNESRQTWPDEVRWHNQFSVEAVRLMRGRVPSRVKLAVGCFGVGNPANPADVTLFADAIAVADYFTTHEYGWPTMQSGVGDYCLRYRKMRAALVGLNRPAVLKPWIIGECGIDRGVAGAQPPGDWGGWRSTGIAAQQYADQLRWYRSELAKDSYIVAATVFNLGGEHDWRNFEIGGVSEIEAVVRENPAVVVTPPVVTPPPKPPGGTVSTDIALSAAYKVDLCPNFESGRASTRGIFLHATRGSAATLTAEYANTLAYFKRPGTPASSHLLIGPTEVARCVHDDDASWHAVENNDSSLSIEIAQPASQPAFVQFQYDKAAEACKLWAAKYNIPLVRVMSQNQPGIIGHEDSEQGRRSGKSDPGAKFDWNKFLALLAPPPPIPATGTVIAGFEVGAGFAQFLRANPDAGLPRHNVAYDIYSNAYLWLTASDKYPSGAELVWRKWKNEVRLISWE